MPLREGSGKPLSCDFLAIGMHGFTKSKHTVECLALSISATALKTTALKPHLLQH